MHSSGDRQVDRAPSRTPAVVLAICASLAAIGVFNPTTAASRQAPSNTAPDTKERTRLLDLQHAAVNQLQDAVRDRTPAEQVRRALVAAGRSLEALGADPESGAGAATPTRTILPAAMREELRRAAATLATVPSADAREVTSA